MSCMYVPMSMAVFFGSLSTYFFWTVPFFRFVLRMVELSHSFPIEMRFFVFFFHHFLLNSFESQDGKKVSLFWRIEEPAYLVAKQKSHISTIFNFFFGNVLRRERVVVRCIILMPAEHTHEQLGIYAKRIFHLLYVWRWSASYTQCMRCSHSDRGQRNGKSRRSSSNEANGKRRILSFFYSFVCLYAFCVSSGWNTGACQSKFHCTHSYNGKCHGRWCLCVRKADEMKLKFAQKHSHSIILFNKNFHSENISVSVSTFSMSEEPRFEQFFPAFPFACERGIFENELCTCVAL